MNKNEMKTMFAEAFPFWEKLTEEQQTYLADCSVTASFPKGSNIHDGNECTGVIFVKTGSLRLYMLSEEGKDITLYRMFPGEMCMLSASCAFQNLTFDVFVDAEENSECVVISGCAFASLSEKIPEMKIFALEAAMATFSEVMWVMQQILFMSFDRRLAIFLLDEASKTGSEVIRLTHEQIAKYMGSAREVVSRMLKYFSTEGMVELSRGGVKLANKQKLRRLAL